VQLPKPVEKNRIFGTVSLFTMGPADTKATKLLRLTPEFINGMAVDKRPWHHHLLAFGLSFKWVRPFAGITGSRLTFAGTDGTVAGYRWSWKFRYGLKIPVSGITSLIKKESI